MPSPYDTMTLVQLREAFTTLGDQLTASKNDREYIYNVINRRKAQVAAQVKVAELSALEKEALLDVLTTP